MSFEQLRVGPMEGPVIAVTGSSHDLISLKLIAGVVGFVTNGYNLRKCTCPVLNNICHFAHVQGAATSIVGKEPFCWFRA